MLQLDALDSDAVLELDGDIYVLREGGHPTDRADGRRPASSHGRTGAVARLRLTRSHTTFQSRSSGPSRVRPWKKEKTWSLAGNEGPNPPKHYLKSHGPHSGPTKRRIEAASSCHLPAPRLRCNVLRGSTRGVSGVYAELDSRTTYGNLGDIHFYNSPSQVDQVGDER